MMSENRFIAVQIIKAITEGKSLSHSLADNLPILSDCKDRAFVQALCYGVCRYYTRLDIILSYLLKKPIRAKDGDVHSLLMLGLYQLIYMRMPPHAAVTETVNVTEKLNKTWARGLINAVLRTYLRNSDQLLVEIDKEEEALFSHPNWWIIKTREAWPFEWKNILNANNHHPPFALRVNQTRLTREQYLSHFTDAYSIPETTHGLIITTPCAVEKLPGFKTGDVSVQDGAAQLAASLLQLESGQSVLDACAAPGGKLTHILETQPQLARCVAIEKDSTRFASIKENLTRLNLSAELICEDVTQVKDWWDKKLFDRILLDVPCSASGVVRRHPDIKLLKQPEDIAALSYTQFHLLMTLWPLLKPGGFMLYVTCSIFPEENVQVLEKFLSKNEDAAEVKIKTNWGISCSIGRQILPGMHNMDGFYYAKLMKKI